MFSKFLRVCREARYVALRFYRVHHQCFLTGADAKLLRMHKVHRTPSCHYNANWELRSVRDPQMVDTITAGTLYINPEFDILNIACISPSTYRPRRDDRVFYFFHRLKRLDSHDIGITNVAGDSRCMIFIAGNRATVNPALGAARQAVEGSSKISDRSILYHYTS